MKNNNPSISIIMPVYNDQKYISEAIESILNQTFRDFEFIILDDMSTDNTKQIISQYLSDKRIIYIEHNKKLGQSNLTNEGVKTSKAKFVAIMHSDDIAHEDRLKKQFNYMQKYNNIDILGTGAYIIDDKGNVKNKIVKPLKHSSIKNIILKYVPLIHPTVMFRKTIFDKIGYYENIRRAPDYELWLRAMFEGAIFANLAEPLIYYRVHNNQLSAGQKEGIRVANKLVKDAVKKYNIKLTLQEEILMKLKYFVAVFFPKCVSSFLENLYKKLFYYE